MFIFRSRVVAVAAGAAVVVGLGAGSGYAAAVITSADIRDNTIRSIDVRQGTLSLADLSPAAVAGLKNGNIVVRNTRGAFTVTNNSVSLRGDGFRFGPYADGGAQGGSVCTSTLNGKRVSTVRNLAYYSRYTSTGDTGGVGVPYLRIFTQNDTNSWIFSPNTQAPDPDIVEGPFHEWVATSGSWRYNDDAGTGPDSPFADLVNLHGTEVISSVCVTTGFSAGSNLSALLRWIQINGQRFEFLRR